MSEIKVSKSACSAVFAGLLGYLSPSGCHLCLWLWPSPHWGSHMWECKHMPDIWRCGVTRRDKKQRIRKQNPNTAAEFLKGLSGLYTRVEVGLSVFQYEFLEDFCVFVFACEKCLVFTSEWVWQIVHFMCLVCVFLCVFHPKSQSCSVLYRWCLILISSSLLSEVEASFTCAQKMSPAIWAKY